MRNFNDEYRNKLSEYEFEKIKDCVTHIHHIFPKSDYPSICYYLENLIALTPTQHLNYAPPNGKTHEINEQYQNCLLLAKANRIRENLNGNSKNIIYSFANILKVLSVGFNDKNINTENINK